MTASERLLTLNVDDWSVDDVQNWLAYLFYTDGKTMGHHVGDFFQEHDVNGKILQTMGNTDVLQKMGICKIGLQSYLTRFIIEAPNKCMLAV